MIDKKEWDERYEEIKLRHADEDFNNPDNFKAFNDEMSQFFVDYRDAILKETDDAINSINYPHCKLTNEKIIHLINETGSLFDVLLVFTVLGGIIIGLAITYFCPDLFNEMFIFTILISIGFLAVISFGIQKIRMNNAKIFAEEHYQEAQLFKSDVNKVKCVFRPFTLEKRGFKYKLYFDDENNKERDFNLEECEFRKLKKEMDKNTHMTVFVLKYPKYKKGYKYHVFYPEDKFQNLSSIKEKSKNSIQ